MSLENRSCSALFKRAEQLKRWEQSETNKEPPHPRQVARKIKFSADCVFLAACAAGDKEEVIRLLKKGADINTGNVDGLTALHQACIDDDLDMVEFLVEQGADINRGDNEGWTPLHATASCGFKSIAKYLIEQGSNLAAVNNDGELALDIAESDEMEEMLQEHINKAGIDCDQARCEEERMMLNDAKAWRSGAPGKDLMHPRSGATALHVAAAKGYVKVMHILLQARCDVNAKDNDGWTPLHGAAHWGQIEACKLLVENFCDMDIKNYAGQTAFDVADSDIVKALEELKKKQEVKLKDHPQIINKQSTIPKKRVSTNKENLVIDQEGTDTYEEETPNKVKKVELEIQSDKEESSVATNTDVEKKNRVNREETVSHTIPSENKVPNLAPALPPPQQHTENNEESIVPSWRRSGSFRTRGLDAETVNNLLSTRIEEREKPVTKISTSQVEIPEEPEVVLRRTHSFEADEKKKEVKLNLESSQLQQDISPESLIMQNKLLPTSPVPAHLTSSVTSPIPANQIRRSFVPPVRDEESETQRKAHAKRVRETRRSTQGVTLDEIKSAEQLVKKKQQQSNDVGLHPTTTIATTTVTSLMSSPLITQAAVTTASSTTMTALITATITTAIPTTVSATMKQSTQLPTPNVEVETNLPERRPSWRLKVDGSSKFQLEDANSRSLANDITMTYIRRPSGGTIIPRPSSAPVDTIVASTTDTTVTLPLRRPLKPPDDKEQDKENDSRNAQATQAVIQRRRRPKRRSTGVVHVDMDEIDPEKQDGITSGDGDENQINHNESGHDRSSRLGSVSSLGSEQDGFLVSRGTKSVASTIASENGELDYKKLYEESQADNEQLREKLRKTDEQLKETKCLLDKAQQAQHKFSLSETEKRERRAMERKLSEMEEELKQLQKLKAENERLKAENRALTRVVSKLTNTAK